MIWSLGISIVRQRSVRENEEEGDIGRSGIQGLGSWVDGSRLTGLREYSSK